MKRKSLIIIACILGFLYANPTFAQESVNINSEEQVKIKDMRIAIGGGYAYRLGKIIKTGDSYIDELSRDLRNGFNIDLDAQYFFKDSWGLGMNINYASSIVNGGSIKETNRFIYVGPMFSARYDFKKFVLLLNAGIGPIIFNVKDEYMTGESSFTKVAFGSQISASIEYKVGQNIGLGFKTGITAGSVKIDLIDEKMNVSNLILGGFISFRSW